MNIIKKMMTLCCSAFVIFSTSMGMNQDSNVVVDKEEVNGIIQRINDANQLSDLEGVHDQIDNLDEGYNVLATLFSMLNSKQRSLKLNKIESQLTDQISEDDLIDVFGLLGSMLDHSFMEEEKNRISGLLQQVIAIAQKHNIELY